MPLFNINNNERNKKATTILYAEYTDRSGFQNFVYLQHKALVSLKQQHAELDREIEHKIADLNAAQQKNITLKGETIDA